MNAPTPFSESSDSQLSVALFGSFCRVIEGATADRKLVMFSLMGRFTADELAAQRHQYMDDLTLVAEESGLTNLVGATAVQRALAAAFSTHDGEVAPVYDGSTFRDACGRADAESHRRTSSTVSHAEELLASTKQALSYLLRQNDLDRLERFIAEHSPDQAAAMLAFVNRRRS